MTPDQQGDGHRRQHARHQRRRRTPGHPSALPAHLSVRPWGDPRWVPAAVRRQNASGTVPSGAAIGAPAARSRTGAHLAGAAGGQDLLIAIFLAGSRSGAGMRISSTPAV